MTNTISDTQQYDLFVRVDRNTAIGSVLRGLVHAARNPLQSIVIAAMTIAEESDQADPIMTKLIEEQTHQLTDVLNKLSDLATPPAGDAVPTQLDHVVSYVLEMQRFQRLGTIVEVHADLPANLPLVYVSGSALQHALLNVLTNAKEAVQHQADGGVWLSARSDGDVVTVTVEDDGPGIPEDLGDRIFAPYVTSKPARAGLGLTVAQYLVERDGGSLAYGKSDAHGGACMTIRLPVWRDDD